MDIDKKFSNWQMYLPNVLGILSKVSPSLSSKLQTSLFNNNFVTAVEGEYYKTQYMLELREPLCEIERKRTGTRSKELLIHQSRISTEMYKTLLNFEGMMSRAVSLKKRDDREVLKVGKVVTKE